MKKIVLFLSILALGMVAMSQKVVIPTPTVTGSTYQYVSTDYTLTNTLGRSFVFSLPLAWPATQLATIHLDSLTGNHTAVAVTLYGQTSAVKGDSTSIATKTWASTGADTTITLINATANRYVKYILHVKGTGTGTTRVADMELKLFQSGQ
jgi:hypothetical protein